jgi:hypothetical protein
MNPRHETTAMNLHRVMAGLLTGPGRKAARMVTGETISGPDEIQGYGYADDENVGVDWGHAANLAFNPVAQYHAIQREMGGGGGQRRPQRRGHHFGPPMIGPQQVQGGHQGPARLLSYMGLGSVAWASTDTLFEKLLSAAPQTAFRGRRLVIAQAKSTGAVGILVVVSSPLNVSGMPQTPAPDVDAPVEMFDPATTYSMLDLQIATSATSISLGLAVSAIPASGQTVTVSAGLYGEWLR